MKDRIVIEHTDEMLEMFWCHEAVEVSQSLHCWEDKYIIDEITYYVSGAIKNNHVLVEMETDQ